MNFRSMEEFWPFYMNQHSKPATRRWHFAGTLGSILCLAFSLCFSWWLLFLVPLLGYGLPWYSHFFVEGNTPATFGHPGWSLLCDFKMFGLMLTGQLDREIKRLGKRPAMQLSLFAETLNEMLQYQMGSRILLFLQQLRVKFMKKRCQGKRQREESSKDIDEKSSEKRRKTDESKPAKVDADGAVQMDDKTAPKDTTLIDNIKGNSEEDPEQCDDLKKDPEVPEEDGETVEDNGENNLSNKEDAEVLMKSEDSVVKLEPFDNLIDEAGISTENQDIKPLLHSSNNKKENVVDDVKPEEVVDNEREEREKESPEEKLSKHSQIENQASKKKMASSSVDKELLKAFRYFDRNRAGYIRVEDMRLIIHNLGTFLSHRDVKELVQSALLESNTGRNDRILYNKLIANNRF